MSIKNDNGKGNLLISYLFKSDDPIKQIDEEAEIKNEIANLLDSKGYKFVIADDDLINEKLLDNSQPFEKVKGGSEIIKELNYDDILNTWNDKVLEKADECLKKSEEFKLDSKEFWKYKSQADAFYLALAMLSNEERKAERRARTKRV